MSVCFHLGQHNSSAYSASLLHSHRNFGYLHGSLTPTQKFRITPRVSYTYTEILDFSSTQSKCQWATNPESILTPITQLEVYVISMTVCLLWATELFGSHFGSLTPMFQAFHFRGLTTPFLLCPHTLSKFHFLCLNRETLIRRHPKYELTTHSSTLMIDDHTHAHTPNIMRCPVHMQC